METDSRKIIGSVRWNRALNLVKANMLGVEQRVLADVLLGDEALRKETYKEIVDLNAAIKANPDLIWLKIATMYSPRASNKIAFYNKLSSMAAPSSQHEDIK